MKKTIFVFLMVAMLVMTSFAGCGGDENITNNTFKIEILAPTITHK